MITNYPLGDFLIRVKNAKLAQNTELSVPMTKMVKAAAEVLKDEGFLREVEQKDGVLNVSLAFKNKLPVLMDLKLVSKLGLRVYKNVDELKAHRGASIFIVSTPRGVMSSKKALKENVGGEVIAEVW